MQELKIGLIGTGMIGRTHIERINTRLQGGRVVACADVNAEFCKSVAEKYGIRAFTSGEELIADQEIDAVIVTTIDDFHEQYVMAAVKAGKYVFCEKPLAPKAEACQRIVDAEITGGKKLVQVGFMRRYDPGYRQLKAHISSGEFGAPLMLHCAHRNPEIKGWKTEMSVENSLIHEIDVLRWLLGEDYAEVEVVFPKSTAHAEDGVRDPQIMILTTASGVRIDVESFVNCRYGYDVRCEVVCEEGTMSLPDPANAILRTNAASVHPICKDWSQRFVIAYDTEFQEWIDACRAGRVDGPNAWDGYVGQVTAAAASKARDTQQRVAIACDARPAFYKN